MPVHSRVTDSSPRATDRLRVCPDRGGVVLQEMAKSSSSHDLVVVLVHNLHQYPTPAADSLMTVPGSVATEPTSGATDSGSHLPWVATDPQQISSARSQKKARTSGHLHKGTDVNDWVLPPVSGNDKIKARSMRRWKHLPPNGTKVQGRLRGMVEAIPTYSEYYLGYYVMYTLSCHSHFHRSMPIHLSKEVVILLATDRHSPYLQLSCIAPCTRSRAGRVPARSRHRLGLGH
ncbi:hypothetical protein C8Q74DRAFT_321828 [Fomes fomentarius]|nr:hypothetical protein C8Q74DRAFT_321828 [Fomes fomentarius]